MLTERTILKNIFGFLLLLLLISGCEKLDTPVFSDSDEIERYIADDALAKIFFSTDNLVSELPYFYPFDSTGYYVDLRDSIDREIITFFPLKEYGEGYADPLQEFGPPFGSSQDAEVTVHDRVYARTIRVEGTDTTVMNELLYRDYYRYGYFMKLGSDAQKYSGWLLRGFSGGSPDRNSKMSMYHADNKWFSGDPLSYQHYESAIMADVIKFDTLLNDSIIVFDTVKHYITRRGYLLLNGDPAVDKLIERTIPGEQLRAEITSTFLGVFYTMSYINSDSAVLKNFTKNNDSTNYEVTIQTSSVINNEWDFIYFQEFVRTQDDTTAVPRFQTLKRRNWVIPFKAE